MLSVKETAAIIISGYMYPQPTHTSSSRVNMGYERSVFSTGLRFESPYRSGEKLNFQINPKSHNNCIVFPQKFAFRALLMRLLLQSCHLAE